VLQGVRALSVQAILGAKELLLKGLEQEEWKMMHAADAEHVPETRLCRISLAPPPPPPPPPCDGADWVTEPIVQKYDRSNEMEEGFGSAEKEIEAFCNDDSMDAEERLTSDQSPEAAEAASDLPAEGSESEESAAVEQASDDVNEATQSSLEEQEEVFELPQE
ncbi:unnamed protein product, partial [Symbiodinium pilosum]